MYYIYGVSVPSLLTESTDSMILYICTCSIYIVILCNEKYFSDDHFLMYSPCPNVEGIKDALSYKFRRLTIGQNCAMCTNKVAKNRILELKQAAQCRAFLLGRPLSLEWSERQGLFFVSLVADSTFEQSENVAITRWVWAAVLGLQWVVWSTP